MEKDYFDLLIIFGKEWEEEWRDKTLRDYCFYIVCLKKKGKLDCSQEKSCGNLAGILKEKIKEMKEKLKEIEKNDEPVGITSKELYERILGFLRGVECLEMKKSKFIKIERLAPAVPATDSTNFPLREGGILEEQTL